jgi:hypothetical protein
MDRVGDPGYSSAARLQSALGEFFAGSLSFHQGSGRRANGAGTLSIHYNLGQNIREKLEEEITRTVDQLDASLYDAEVVALKVRHAIYWLQSVW